MLRRREDALDFYRRVDLTGERFEFSLVHVPAEKFIEPASEPGLLRRALRHRNDYLARSLLNAVTHQDCPRKILNGLHKAFEPFFLYAESRDNIFGSHPCDS